MVLSSIMNKIAPNSDLAETIFPPASKFSVDDMPDLTGKVIMVTGGNAGIGWETAKALLNKGAKVYIACRSEEKARQAIDELKRETGGKEAIYHPLDLGDLHKVKQSANDFMSRESRLDVLFNSAGVMAPPPDQLTAQDYDLQFGTNTLAPYYFTKLLMPALKASTKQTGAKARVVNTSSSAHKFVPSETINFDTLTKGEKRDQIVKKWGAIAKWRLYAQSKIGNIFVSHILNDEYGSDIVSAALHPGGIRTKLQRHMGWQAAVINPFMHPQPMGALTQLYVGTTAPEGEIRGKYFIPWAREGKAIAPSDDVQLRQQVKEWMDKQLASI